MSIASLVEAREVLQESIAKGADIAVYLDKLDPLLAREIARWKRRMLLASLKGKNPGSEPMPPTMRPELLRAYVSSSRKLVVSDSQIAEVETSEKEEETQE